jgi:hypothetical protein
MVCSIFSSWLWEPALPLLLLEAHTTSRIVVDLRQDFFGYVGGAELMVLVVGGVKEKRTFLGAEVGCGVFEVSLNRSSIKPTRTDSNGGHTGAPRLEGV